MKVVFSGKAKSINQVLNRIQQSGWQVQIDFQEGNRFSAITEIEEKEIKTFYAFFSALRRTLSDDFILYSLYDASTGRELRTSSPENEEEQNRQARLRTPTAVQDVGLEID